MRGGTGYAGNSCLSVLLQAGDGVDSLRDTAHSGAGSEGLRAVHDAVLAALGVSLQVGRDALLAHALAGAGEEVLSLVDNVSDVER